MRQITGGLRVVQMIAKSNILLMVATGENPDYPSDQVLLWDDKKLDIQHKI